MRLGVGIRKSRIIFQNTVSVIWKFLKASGRNRVWSTYLKKGRSEKGRIGVRLAHSVGWSTMNNSVEQQRDFYNQHLMLSLGGFALLRCKNTLRSRKFPLKYSVYQSRCMCVWERVCVYEYEQMKKGQRWMSRMTQLRAVPTYGHHACDAEMTHKAVNPNNVTGSLVQKFTEMPWEFMTSKGHSIWDPNQSYL